MFDMLLDVFMDAARAIKKKASQKKKGFDTRIIAAFQSWKHMLFHAVHIGVVALFIGAVRMLLEAGCEFGSCFLTGPVALLLFPHVVAYAITAFMRIDYWKLYAFSIIGEVVALLLTAVYGGAYLWELWQLK